MASAHHPAASAKPGQPARAVPGGVSDAARATLIVAILFVAYVLWSQKAFRLPASVLVSPAEADPTPASP